MLDKSGVRKRSRCRTGEKRGRIRNECAASNPPGSEYGYECAMPQAKCGPCPYEEVVAIGGFQTRTGSSICFPRGLRFVAFAHRLLGAIEYSKSSSLPRLMLRGLDIEELIRELGCTPGPYPGRGGG